MSKEQVRREEFKVSGEALVDKIKELAHESNIRRIKINDFQEAIQFVDDYIHFYNHDRIQLKTKLTPLEFRRQFV